MDCLLCSEDIAAHVDTLGDTVETKCPRCGHFKYTTASYQQLINLAASKRTLLAGWVWEQNHSGYIPTFTADNVALLTTARPLPFFEKAKRLLVYMAEQTDTLGKRLDLSDRRLGPMLQTFNYGEVEFVVNFLIEQGWLHKSTGDPHMRVTGDGFLKADEWRHSTTASIQGFVAMWFDPALEDAWLNGFHRGISDAGYKPLRIDQKEHANKICDEIISEIRRSRFLVADYTGHRGGVYYEAGFASGQGLPVILTCKREDMNKLHFDIRQYNCIDWETPADLASRLKARIAAVIGDGPLK